MDITLKLSLAGETLANGRPSHAWAETYSIR